MNDRELEQLGVIATVAAMNDELRSWISEHASEVPVDLLQQLADLDSVVRAGYARTRGNAVRHLRRRGGAPKGGYRIPGLPLLEQARRRVEQALRRDPEHRPETAQDAVTPRPELQLLEGHVWCAKHNTVHEDSTDAFGGECDALDRRDLYVRDPGG